MLPWWQHPINILTLVITAAVLAALVGWMVGDSSSELEHSEVDTGFLQDMREHHEQAVYMGFVYRSLADIDPGLNTVAGSIIRGQDIDIGRMIQMLRIFGEAEANEGDTSMAWMGMPTPRGEMPGMATEEDLERLGTLSGAEADELFVELMTRPPPRRDPHGRVRGRTTPSPRQCARWRRRWRAAKRTRSPRWSASSPIDRTAGGRATRQIDGPLVHSHRCRPRRERPATAWSWRSHSRSPARQRVLIDQGVSTIAAEQSPSRRADARSTTTLGRLRPRRVDAAPTTGTVDPMRRRLRSHRRCPAITEPELLADIPIDEVVNVDDNKPARELRRLRRRRPDRHRALVGRGLPNRLRRAVRAARGWRSTPGIRSAPTTCPAAART